MNDSLPWRFHAARALARHLPPFIAPLVTSRVYGFEHARGIAAQRWAEAVTGSRARWPLGELHGWFQAVNGYYDWRLLTVAQTVCARGDTIVEVGANIGTETLGFADIVGRGGHVVALEPYGPNVDVLQRVVEDAAADQVRVRAVAAADAPGTLPFAAPADPRYSGVGHLGTDDGSATVEVEVTTLDALVADGVKPALVAMDVEGGELAVLRGARRLLQRIRPVMVLEACASHAVRAGGSLDAVRAELEGHGYTVRAIRRFGLRTAVTTPDAEPCNWVAVPDERDDLLGAISARIALVGALPPWRWLNPLARCAEAGEVSLLRSSSSRGLS